MSADYPDIGPMQSKVWGSTFLAFLYNSVEVHAIQVIRGGYCSRHKHEHKYNRFVVLHGKLAVRMYLENMASPEETIVEAGGVTDVPPGVVHEFEALEETLAVEAYWTILDREDIIRQNTGGVKCQAEPDN